MRQHAGVYVCVPLPRNNQTSPLSCRWPHDPVAPPLVRPEGRDLHVVPGQAGLGQVRLALQEGRGDVHLVTPQLEDALVRPARLQTHVLRERQRGETEGNHRHPHCEVSLFFFYAFIVMTKGYATKFAVLHLLKTEPSTQTRTYHNKWKISDKNTDHHQAIWVSCREIVDNHEKENALNVVTDERTYQIYAESPEDARYVSSVPPCGCQEEAQGITVNVTFADSLLFFPLLTHSDLVQLLVQRAESGPQRQPGAAHGDAP